MVMTQRTSPGLSALGLALAAGVAAAGMFVTPTLACPEDDKTTPCPPSASQAATPEEARTPPLAPSALIAPPEMVISALLAPEATPIAPGEALPESPLAPTFISPTSFEMHMNGQAQPEDPDLRELLRLIERLEA